MQDSLRCFQKALPLKSATGKKKITPKHQGGQNASYKHFEKLRMIWVTSGVITLDNIGLQINQCGKSPHFHK